MSNLIALQFLLLLQKYYFKFVLPLFEYKFLPLYPPILTDLKLQIMYFFIDISFREKVCFRNWNFMVLVKLIFKPFGPVDAL